MPAGSGRIDGGQVVLERSRGPRRPALAVDRIAEPIPIVTATVAMDAAVLDALVALRPAGIVVAATGAGNTSPELLAAAERAMAAGIPVVLASRTASGAAGTGYAFPGGGATWARAGALLAGTLTPPKARIALGVGLGAGLTGDALARFVAGPPAGPIDGPVADDDGGVGAMTARAGLIVEGRIATLAGATGFGWVEALAVGRRPGDRRRLAGGRRRPRRPDDPAPGARARTRSRSRA